MNNTLIDQLKLAIQVESGEVDWREIQLKEKTPPAKWEDIPGKPCWNFPQYEYRRKPKPLECWVAEYANGHRLMMWDPNHEPLVRNVNCDEPTRMIKMREVIE